jgi:DnaJ-domain-containing protein 1
MNAYELLGVAENASEQEIRAAYLSKVKEFPPDQSPREFEGVRDAYEALRDPRKRAEAMLTSTAFTAPLVSLIDSRPANRVFAGPQLWREVLKTK